MAHLYRDTGVKSLYTDRKCNGGQREWQQRIEESTTLYVGNLSFYSTEEQLHAIFGRCGEVKRVVMGLDRNTKTPCGFCFVEYCRRADCEDAVKYLNSCKLDDRVMRADWDGGFVEGRQYGRGRSGGQVRDEYRADYDAERGGWGKAQDAPPPDAVRRPQGGKGNRRRSYDGPYRGPGGGRGRGRGGYGRGGGGGGDFGGGGRGGGGDDGEQSAKRTRTEEPEQKNARFREERDDDDDD